MNPNNANSENLLKNLLPLVLVLIVLIAGIIITPRLSADPRSRASEPVQTTVTPRPTFPPMTTQPETPEIICTDLYSPVCDPNTDTTYSNSCEAQKMGVFKTLSGECDTQEPLSLPSAN